MTSPFHPGEREIQRRAGVEDMAEQVGAGIDSEIPFGAARFLARQRLAVATSLDGDGRVWASLLTGDPGFITATDTQLVRAQVRPTSGDPLWPNLKQRPELGLLVIDPTTRQRMRFNGRGLVSPDGLFLMAKQVYGNCPKYIQKRRLRTEPGAPEPGRVKVSAQLSDGQRAWIEDADTLFIGSFHPEGGADASHRGGRPGFVTVSGPNELSFPDYPGNAMFNTLGNLSAYSQAGLLFVDFESGDVLQLAGRARIDDDFAVHFTIDAVRETPHASALRFDLVEYSPSNPPVTHDHARHPKA
jgi:predicted pyridoxine 5'-phosphate oxidase superfamily flavin-nucleotide-binding protein